jgi:hypothetical protein
MILEIMGGIIIILLTVILLSISGNRKSRSWGLPPRGFKK